jgi:hypothetical protein
MFSLLSFMFFLQQNLKTRGWTGSAWSQGEERDVAQIMYTHVSKCKNDNSFF